MELVLNLEALSLAVLNLADLKSAGLNLADLSLADLSLTVLNLADRSLATLSLAILNLAVLNLGALNLVGPNLADLLLTGNQQEFQDLSLVVYQNFLDRSLWLKSIHQSHASPLKHMAARKIGQSFHGLEGLELESRQ